MTEEKKTRNAGRSTRQMANKRRTKAMIYLVLLIIAFSILVLIWTNSKNWGIGGLGLLGIILFFRILMDIFDARAERQIKEKD